MRCAMAGFGLAVCSDASLRDLERGGSIRRQEGVMKRLMVFSSLLAIAALSMGAAAYQQGLPAAALAATKIEKVRDNMYMITGSDPGLTPADRQSFSGGNTVVFITDNGVVVADTKLAGWGQVLLDKI